MSSFSFIRILLATALIPIAAHAEVELRTEQLLSMDLAALGQLTFSTSSRIAVPFDETIGTSYLVSRDTIKKRGYQSLKDVLEHIPGMVVTHRDVQYVVGVRGLNANDNNKVTLMLNGYEVSGVTEPDFLNGPINLDEVERVEVVVGPSSFFEPANTLAATINVITRKIDGAAASFTKGSDVDYRGSFAVGKKWEEDIWISASFSGERRKGFDIFDDHVGGSFLQATEGNDWGGASDPQFNFVAQGQYQGWSGQFQMYESRRPHLILRGIYNLNPSTTASEWESNSIIDQVYSGTLRYDHDWNSSLKTHAIMRMLSKTDRKSPQISDAANEVNNYKLELGGVYTLQNHTIQSGVQASYDDYTNFSDDNGNIFVDGSTQAIGFYLSDSWQMTERLKAVLGIRVDYNKVLPNSAWYPAGRAALVYQATDNWTTKLMANHVVNMPVPMASLNQLWGANNNNPNAPFWAKFNNTADKPEQLTTLEWQNILYFDERDGRGSITLYYQKMNEFISWGGPWTNLGDFNGYGVEGDLRHLSYEWMDNWLNFSWLDSTFSVGGGEDQRRHVLVDGADRMIGSPRLTVNVGTTIELAKDVYFSPSVRYMTQQSAFDSRDDEFKKINNIYHLDTALLWNNAFTLKGLNLRLRVRNITNARDYIAGSWLKGEYQPRGINGNFSIDYEI